MALVPSVSLSPIPSLQKYLENYLNRLLTMSFYRNYHAMVRSGADTRSLEMDWGQRTRVGRI